LATLLSLKVLLDLIQSLGSFLLSASLPLVASKLDEILVHKAVPGAEALIIGELFHLLEV